MATDTTTAYPTPYLHRAVGSSTSTSYDPVAADEPTSPSNDTPLFIVKKTGPAAAWDKLKRWFGAKRDPREEAFYASVKRAPSMGSTGSAEKFGTTGRLIKGKEKEGVYVEDEVDGMDQRSLRRRRRVRFWKACCLIYLGVSLLAFAILFPVLQLLVIPAWISAAFSNPNSSSTTSLERLSLLRFLDASRDADLLASRFPSQTAAYLNTPATASTTGANVTTAKNGAVGGFEIGLVLSQNNYNVPLNIPLTAKGTTWWGLSVPSAYVQNADPAAAAAAAAAAGKVGKGAYKELWGVGLGGGGEEDGRWKSFAQFVIPEDVPIRDKKLMVNSDLVTFRVPVYTGNPLPDYLRGQTWPLGRSLIQGILRCFLTGNPAAAPPVRLWSNAVTFGLGATNLPIRNVDLWYDYEVGKLLVDAGFTLPYLLNSTAAALSKPVNTPSSSTTAAAGSTFAVKFRNLTYLTDKTALLDADMDLTLPFESPVSANFKNLQLRLNVSTSALATGYVRSLEATAGSRLVKVSVSVRTAWNVSPPKDVVEKLVALLSTSADKWGPEWYVSIDGVKLGSQKGDTTPEAPPAAPAANTTSGATTVLLTGTRPPSTTTTRLARRAPQATSTPSASTDEPTRAWLDDFLSAMEVKIPLKDAYDSVVRPLLSAAANVTLPTSNRPSELNSSPSTSGASGTPSTSGGSVSASSASGNATLNGLINGLPSSSNGPSSSGSSPLSGGVPSTSGGSVPSSNNPLAALINAPSPNIPSTSGGSVPGAAPVVPNGTPSPSGPATSGPATSGPALSSNNAPATNGGGASAAPPVNAGTPGTSGGSVPASSSNTGTSSGTPGNSGSPSSSGGSSGTSPSSGGTSGTPSSGGSSGGSTGDSTGGSTGGGAAAGGLGNVSSLLTDALKNLKLDLDFIKVISPLLGPGPNDPSVFTPRGLPIAGGIDISTFVKASGIAIPLPLDLTVRLAGRSGVTVEVPRRYAYDKVLRRPLQVSGIVEQEWYPMANLFWSDPIVFDLKNQTGALTVSQTKAGFRFPVYNEQEATKLGGIVTGAEVAPGAQINRSPDGWSLGVGFARGLADCLIRTGDAVDIPPVRITSELTFYINELEVPNIPLSVVLDIGTSIVNAGFTLKAFEAGPGLGLGGSSSGGSGGSGAPLPGGITFGVSNIKPFPSRSGLVSADFSIGLPIPDPLEFAVQSLSLRLKLQNTAVAYVAVDGFSSQLGAKAITFSGQILAPWAPKPSPRLPDSPSAADIVKFAVGLVGKDPLSWMIGIDGLNLVDGAGVRHGWFDDFLEQITIDIPVRLIYREVKPLLDSFLSGLNPFGRRALPSGGAALVARDDEEEREKEERLKLAKGVAAFYERWATLAVEAEEKEGLAVQATDAHEEGTAPRFFDDLVAAGLVDGDVKKHAEELGWI
ncbi:hypothetical protein HDU96_005664 [Phlyctochytrium bullatum]|nr:hypothetical protein HDU96_005664 [Phlyctochytrium bullatum]